MHEETTSRPMSVPSSVAATTTQPTATDHNSAELQVSFSSNSAGGGGGGMDAAGYQAAPPPAAAGPAPAPSGAGGGGGGGPDLPDTKEGIEELCPVCGDKVSGYHYGLLTCESCKGFFKRTVQNKKVYTCVADRSCHIDKTQRKRCPFCRFQKCLDVGMKLEAVRADRMRGGRNKFGPMYKRDRARKLQMMRQRQIALQTLRGGAHAHLGDGVTLCYSPGGQAAVAAAAFGSLHIKQEIQIPQVSSLTSSPDSSPSPIAVGMGHVASSSAASVAAAAAAAAASSASGAAVAGLAGPGSAASVSLDHKLWGGGAPSPKALQQLEAGAAPKVPAMVREFVQALDDREWQNSLYSLLQNQTYNQCEVDLFELMCKVLDQNLFSQVDWARNSVFFKDLKVDDQMKLLQHSWSDMLVLDHLHQRMHNSLPDETSLPNGQKFDLLCLGLLGVPGLAARFHDLTAALQDLKFDVSDYVCLKFLLLLNPDVRGIVNRKHVQEGHDQVQHALLDYTQTCYPQIQDKFGKLMMVKPEIHQLASRGEDHLYLKHCDGSAPTQTLLMEMLHAKRK
ncbi:nuclear hormone receptor FTZ-F1 isoform X2 [Bacillus rossius redtenbacheri]|uniref:nuclear hormone receptor FTZ-F1 isoform X2 n=1 Tax=Bacillus rossius redtenbacheri TaxID=93214 RepID=UPI002FDD81B6